MYQSVLARNRGVGSRVNNAGVGAEVEAEADAISHVFHPTCVAVARSTCKRITMSWRGCQSSKNVNRPSSMH